MIVAKLWIKGCRQLMAVVFITLIAVAISIANSYNPRVIPIVIELIPPPNIVKPVIAIGGRGTAYNIKTVGFVYFDPCLWNLDLSNPAVNGYTVMNITPNMLVVESNYSYVVGMGTGWFRDFIGYHRVGYGVHPWESRPYTIPSFYLPLPLRVKDLPSIYINLNYTIIVDDTGWMDIAFDIWLKRSPPPIRGMTRGDLEIMLWLYWKPPLPGGAIHVKTVNITMTINNSVIKTEWMVLIVPEVAEPSPGGWTWIIMVLKNPLPRGHILLNLNAFLNIAKDTILTFFWPTKPQWNEDIFDNLYLWDIEFGSEIARKNTGGLYLRWTIYRYSLLLFSKDVDTLIGYRLLLNDLNVIKDVPTLTLTATDIVTVVKTVHETIVRTYTTTEKSTRTVTEVTTITYTITTIHSEFHPIEYMLPALMGFLIGSILALVISLRVRK